MSRLPVQSGLLHDSERNHRHERSALRHKQSFVLSRFGLVYPVASVAGFLIAKSKNRKVESVDFVRDKIEMPYGMSTAGVDFSAIAIDALPLAIRLHPFFC